MADPVSDSTATAFRQWKKRSTAFVKYLNGLTKEEIVARSLKNQKELRDLGENMEYYQSELDDLKQQREYLIEKVIIGQRLALARCNFSYKYAKEKVWVRIVENSRNAMKG